MAEVLGKETSRAIILTAWIILLVVVVVTPLAAVFMMVMSWPVPDALEKWASICYGFIFAALFQKMIERI